MKNMKHYYEMGCPDSMAAYFLGRVGLSVDDFLLRAISEPLRQREVLKNWKHEDESIADRCVRFEATLANISVLPNVDIDNPAHDIIESIKSIAKQELER